MGLFTALLPVSEAMMLHGASQLAANGSRALLHRRHVRTTVLVPYLAGAFAVTGLLLAVTYVPSKPVVYILLGVFPFLALVAPRLSQLDVTRRPQAVMAGIVVTGLQLVAGASGPILDLFFLDAKLDRHEVVATKALTQAAGHTLKLLFYAAMSSRLAEEASLPTAIYPAVAALALLGTYLGSHVLDRMSDAAFRRWSRYAVMTVGAIYLVKGIGMMVGA
jgi:uncharacterized membrane protein YfcA